MRRTSLGCRPLGGDRDWRDKCAYIILFAFVSGPLSLTADLFLDFLMVSSDVTIHAKLTGPRLHKVEEGSVASKRRRSLPILLICESICPNLGDWEFA